MLESSCVSDLSYANDWDIFSGTGIAGIYGRLGRDGNLIVGIVGNWGSFGLAGKYLVQVEMDGSFKLFSFSISLINSNL